MDLYGTIFHEKQEGQLCAQHALNALLQGAYFTAVDLAEIAKQLDEEETRAMAEGNVGGLESEEYRKFLKEGSSNYDDSGFFSVQVISKALSVWGLDIVPIGAEQAVAAKVNPAEENAFICNLQEHWFTLRRFGGSPKRWYNLNSVFNGPEYVSETYLGLLLAQLQNEGYSIFVVRGGLPQSEADVYAQTDPVPAPSQIPKGPAKTGNKPEALSGAGNSLQVTGTRINGGDDDELARAIAMSLGEPMQVGDPEDEELKRALAASLAEGGVDSVSLKQAIDASLRDDETRAMNEAINASLSASASQEASAESQLNAEEIRRRRLDRFGT